MPRRSSAFVPWLAGVFMGLLYEGAPEGPAFARGPRGRRPPVDSIRSRAGIRARRLACEDGGVPPRLGAVWSARGVIKNTRRVKINPTSGRPTVGSPLTRGNRNEWPGVREGSRMDATPGSYVTLDCVTPALFPLCHKTLTRKRLSTRFCLSS